MTVLPTLPSRKARTSTRTTGGKKSSVGKLARKNSRNIPLYDNRPFQRRQSSNSNSNAYQLPTCSLHPWSWSNVGLSAAAKLRENGYRVALGSRSGKAASTNAEHLNVQVDATKRESIDSAFDTVVEKLGPVNVVIYNGVRCAWYRRIYRCSRSFKKDVHRDHPRAFIVNGNILPFAQYTPPKGFTLGVQKALEVRFIATASKSYDAENFHFYFPSLVTNDGGLVADYSMFLQSGQAHAKVYWDLINDKKQAALLHGTIALLSTERLTVLPLKRRYFSLVVCNIMLCNL
ncbi:hypothetical protein CPB84DRAFT_653979 [Gymnopilus junonius]|uniref:Uncharacterized protein n=1 Tax=Gymnopilus junonius TaxID=109634 RepID=A0A9P5NTI9_GYMJU|nr:hypothetical protein CPB84DRAFT_653979 [Gymnopilus junonius]